MEKKQNCQRMKSPIWPIEVHNDNHAKKNGLLVLFIFFPTTLDQGVPSFRNQFRLKKRYTSIVARLFVPKNGFPGVQGR